MLHDIKRVSLIFSGFEAAVFVMRLFGYTRVSGNTQRHNTSFESQSQAIQNYCQLYGHVLIDLRKESESASGRVQRKVFDKTLVDTLRGEADGIIVLRLDRFARCTLDGLQTAQTLESAGKHLIAVELHMDTSTAVGRFIFTSLLASAQLERDMINSRCEDGRKLVRDNGFYAGGRPAYGYKIVGTRGKHVQIEDEAEQSVIRSLLSLRESGMSFREITQYLHSQNLLNKRGKDWHVSTVAAIITLHSKAPPNVVAAKECVNSA